MNPTELIVRSRIKEGTNGRRVIIETKSGELWGDGRWSNCLYLAFLKEDFPDLQYPKIRDFGDEYESLRQIFNYTDMDDCSVARLPWHKGITYYRESYFPESGQTEVKCGCDFNHYMDDEYERRDCGFNILNGEGEYIFKEFLELVRMSEKKIEGSE